ncbi:MAG: sigma-70 family RNA polymerase sigma factor [Calditrichaceae bacterium]|jgi:RNA polymerase sigma factor (sigma-70 family)
MDQIENIYKKHYKKIYHLAHRMTGNKEDASDITQETFIQAVKSFNQFRGESRIYTWLYKIARNKCLRFLENKKRSTFSSFKEIIHEASSTVSENISKEDRLLYINQVKDGCLSGLLRCLSLQQRIAFILNVLLDLPVRHVSHIIEKTENATRILIHRAKQNIRNFLCKNCSLYDAANTCRCENLINFSLKQNWIGLNNTYKHIKQAESEIKDLKNIIGLYKSLPEITPAKEMHTKIQQILARKKEFLILNEKKVK